MLFHYRTSRGASNHHTVCQYGHCTAVPAASSAIPVPDIMIASGDKDLGEAEGDVERGAHRDRCGLPCARSVPGIA
eukprot:3523067-Rhodomonas_salina.2